LKSTRKPREGKPREKKGECSPLALAGGNKMKGEGGGAVLRCGLGRGITKGAGRCHDLLKIPVLNI